MPRSSLTPPRAATLRAAASPSADAVTAPGSAPRVAAPRTGAGLERAEQGGPDTLKFDGSPSEAGGSPSETAGAGTQGAGAGTDGSRSAIEGTATQRAGTANQRVLVGR
ncbi:hypothetical protein [Brachybacterium sp. p3-SID957]|uniref:hypothetical protein n=1 Tax=Brachybacterium sp. p3-SID957 TaxID=2916049 RepID=UPI00223AF3B6|nr:hypothetical protein [Brachybacterium sp. p3-SID957]MCT1775646.1 hypothetical protein [Brachybacterium sp. p3-SID957]